MSTRTADRQHTMRYLKTIGIVNNGSNGRGFAYPYDLAVAKDGRMFVLNRWELAPRIGICTLDDEEYLGEFGNGYGSEDGQFTLPVAIAFDSGETLYVTDEYLHRVSMFTSDGEYLGKWGDHGSGAGQLDGPAGIAFDSEDHAYVVDQHNHRVQKFTNRGEHLATWGGPGDGLGQFNMPWGVALGSDGDVYVADWRNDRIQRFTLDGEFVASFGASGGGDGQLHRPSQVAVDRDGFIYVADWGNERVQVLSPDGSFVQRLRGQATVSRWAAEFFASNPDEQLERDKANLVPDLPEHLSTPYHVSSQTEPYFWGPVSVTLDGQGRLYVTETNRHRFQVYEPG